MGEPALPGRPSFLIVFEYGDGHDRQARNKRPLNFPFGWRSDQLP